MILLDENEYEKTLNELSEIPFGGKQQKSTITQHELHPKVFNEQPVETQATLVSATSQPKTHFIKEQQPTLGLIFRR